MKLYMHPVSMTSRPVRLMIAEHQLPVTEQVVDLFTGEHVRPPYSDMNPNKLVPMLEDGDFRLTESSTILKYLADKFNLEQVYPKELRARARINERMDWFNTNFYRDYGYGMCYPQIFPHHKRPTEDLHNGTIEWSRERVKGWLTVLDTHFIGDRQQYLCGDTLTIADYLGSCLLTLGEVLRLDFSPYPNIQRWLGNIRRLQHWDEINQALYGFKQSVQDQPFVGL